MKNVTITLDENLLSWLKVMAGRSNKSVSRFVAGLVENFRNSIGDEAEILNSFRSFPPRQISEKGKRSFNREEIYDRTRVS